MNSQSTFLFLTYFNSINYVQIIKRCKADNFEPHNSLKLSFTNIRGLCSNFVDWESFFESNSPDILALCETNLNDSIDSGNFSVRGYLPLIRKDSTTHMHDLTVYVTLLRWLTFLLGSQTVILTVVLFWVYFFLLTLVFILQWLSLHWEILIMLLSQFPLTFYQVHNGMLRSSYSL